MQLLKDMEIATQELEVEGLKVHIDINCRFSIPPLCFVIIPGALLSERYVC